MGLFAQWRGTVLARSHQLLGALGRADEPDDPSEPAPSLNRLDALVEGFTAGQPVRWTMAGQPRPLPGPVDVVAYRIIEEALTNACRHAPGAPVGVRLRYDAAGITIEVRDEGAGPAPSGGGTHSAGRGLLGVRRRAERLGGTFSAGPRAGGGFTVRAVLPAPEEMIG
ncbi:ATP-binding protein [Micromonospora sp. NBC_00330]|uniref:sensor histidine kinase n=1 Tax=Micromonospora sp. NBC_00330 TaxID=2903585 RepID=UPI002E2BBB50|nr:ATP-binding protein [Micromonospora sp. NBC_00330]